MTVMSETARRAALKPGDRVTITGSGHPRLGQSGVIAGEFRPDLDLKWRVALDGAYEGECGASEKDLRPA
jgi:hypothetical protein